MSAPTSLRGYVDDQVFWSSILIDIGEQVPDLAWPDSVSTYSQMRRDPKLTAILRSHTLLIRHATWTVDPSGCRPEVVALVADGLGLNQAGSDVQRAARVRGVSWNQHLRAALGQLTWGHMPFEMQAEIRDGKAHLVSLSERMPSSIRQIRVNRDGTLAGMDQDALPGETKAPEIPADRLVWYAHEREGSSWQGTSLLRPAFAAWLIKREMQRVLATSNRRFGQGVPTVRALPGTAPTPAQMAAAALVAQSARVGDQAGASLPPGFVMELVGLSGSVPDTLAFLKWLDGQMSTMALAGILDLGSTDTGSRALGDSFLDLFFMSIQSIADEIADTATRQAAARIVEWNYGPDEPVPAVTVGPVGAKKEVTAQSLQLLLTSGALSADPQLEAYVRRTYRLPQRVEPAAPMVSAGRGGAVPPDRRPVSAGSKAAGATDGAAPGSLPGRKDAARRARHASSGKPGQMSLPIAAATATDGLRRPLTDTEIASGVDFAAVRQDRDDAQAALAEQWPDLIDPIVEYLAVLAGSAVAAGALADLGSIVVPDDLVAAVADAIGSTATALAATSAARVVAEAASQGVTVPAGEPDADRLAEAAAGTAGLIVSGYANGAAAQAMLLAAPEADEQAVAESVRAHLLELGLAVAGAGFVGGALIGVLALAQAAGRMATILMAGPNVVLTASEVLDRSTCRPCSDIDGQVFNSPADAIEAYPTGRYALCLGAARCRGMVVMTVTN